MMILHHGWRSSASRRVRLCLKAALAPSGWLVGTAYSIADIAAAPFVKRIDEEIAPDENTTSRHPRVNEWWGKVQARPAYARANFGPFLES
ncbi:hypothetical protein AS156_19905 [Bradyrhizobium macuxiense]|uniref:Uncharacterized protein n=1 Tax=Bradyrhizobium macuxiense TaxID=1755647 RepID=A0A120FI90_9BRAD|nr:glutathione S-transferase C-terminal domain-containing protein [Bradyrhizobium macuxiense]KWV47137.1 hypothetical protein AS156_19905 [Bradyrhizobium macuxiense]